MNSNLVIFKTNTSYDVVEQDTKKVLAQFQTEELAQQYALSIINSQSQSSNDYQILPFFSPSNENNATNRLLQQQTESQLEQMQLEYMKQQQTPPNIQFVSVPQPQYIPYPINNANAIPQNNMSYGGINQQIRRSVPQRKVLYTDSDEYPTYDPYDNFTMTSDFDGPFNLNNQTGELEIPPTIDATQSLYDNSKNKLLKDQVFDDYGAFVLTEPQKVYTTDDRSHGESINYKYDDLGYENNDFKTIEPIKPIFKTETLDDNSLNALDNLNIANNEKMKNLSKAEKKQVKLMKKQQKKNKSNVELIEDDFDEPEPYLINDNSKQIPNNNQGGKDKYIYDPQPTSINVRQSAVNNVSNYRSNDVSSIYRGSSNVIDLGPEAEEDDIFSNPREDARQYARNNGGDLGDFERFDNNPRLEKKRLKQENKLMKLREKEIAQEYKLKEKSKNK
ncbi:hypothetical protein [Spiroplasma endosymbiont of Labia minor]|uniref:hypothetical protein n=1 Tax=Spiroplasma endosymbiont of Labia minor TaxID=3066305 RepID=UPI0030CC00B4